MRVYVRESSAPPTSPPRQPSRALTIQPPSFTGRPGDLLVLTCRNPMNQYASPTWTKYGYPQLPSYVYVRNGVLTIQSVTVEDSGRYVCSGIKD